MEFNTLRSILSGYWLMEPQQVRLAYLPIVQNILDKSLSFDSEKPSLKIGANTVTGNWSTAFKDTDIPEGSTAILPVDGALTKHGGMCAYGYTDYTAMLKDCQDNPKIKGIVLSIDSPGGMVDGVQTLVDTIRSIDKPTIAFINDGMACSAGYWIAAACDEIVASQKTDTVGSIGVFVTLANWKKYYEQEGLEIHEIYSSKSPDKNKAFKEAMEGDYDRIISTMLDPIASKFQSDIASFRGDKLTGEYTINGGVWMAEEAIERGLIDRIGTIDSAIEMVNNLTSKNTGTMKLFSFLSSDNKAEGVVEIDATELEELRTQIKQAEEKHSDLESRHSALQIEKAAVDTQLANTEADRDAWKQKAETYGKQPGTTPTKPANASTDEVGSEEKDSFLDAKAEHNQLANSLK